MSKLKFMKNTLLLAFFLITISSSGQSLPQRIDLSSDLKKISLYNQHIEKANYYHWKAARRDGSGWFKFITGAALTAGGLYLAQNDISESFELNGETFEEDWETYLQYGGMGVGLGLMLWGATQSNDYRALERQELRNALTELRVIYTIE